MVINAIWGGGEGNVRGIHMDWCDAIAGVTQEYSLCV